MKKCLIGWLVVLGVVCSASAAMTVSPQAGSVFVAGSLTDTNAAVTNAFRLGPAVSATNPPVTVARVLEVSGADSVQIWVEAVQSHAGGNTNNGATTLAFASSPDGVMWTTGSNAFNVVFPSMGTVRAVYQTNVAAATWGSPGYVKLLTLGHTNIGTTYLSNVVLRAVQVK